MSHFFFNSTNTLKSYILFQTLKVEREGLKRESTFDIQHNQQQQANNHSSTDLTSNNYTNSKSASIESGKQIAAAAVASTIPSSLTTVTPLLIPLTFHSDNLMQKSTATEWFSNT